MFNVSLLLRADSNPAGSAVAVVANESSTSPFPASIALATADETILLDINTMSSDAASRRHVIPGSTENVDEVPVVALLFPLLPLSFDARVTKIVFDGSRAVSFLAAVGVNLFVLRVALEELGYSRAPASDAELLSVFASTSATCVHVDTADLAAGLFDTACAASAALFIPHDTLATTPTSATDLQRTRDQSTLPSYYYCFIAAVCTSSG